MNFLQVNSDYCLNKTFLRQKKRDLLLSNRYEKTNTETV